MYQLIVVPLDGTPLAEAAIPVARRLARAAHARIHLVLSHRPAPAVVGGGEIVLPGPDLDTERRKSEDAYLDSIADALSRAGFRDVQATRTEGAPGPAVCEVVNALHADLVVMASHGRGALGRLWQGSVADYVIHQSGVPALIVGPGVEHAELRLGGSILLALDLRPESEALVAPTAAMARLLRGHVRAVHVLVPGQTMGREVAQRRLDRVADRLRDLGCSASSEVVADLSPEVGILGELRGTTHSLVVMCPHARGAVRQLFLGSTAHRVIRASPVPLLVVCGGIGPPSPK